MGIVGEWAYRPLTARNSADDRVFSVVRNQLVLHAGASLVLVDRLRLGIDLPVQAHVDGRAATVGGLTVAAPRDEASLGDLRLAADVRLFGEYGNAITGALGVRVSLPTGNQIKILDQVKFKLNSAEIVASHESEDVLLAVIAVFNAPPRSSWFRSKGIRTSRGAPSAIASSASSAPSL